MFSENRLVDEMLCEKNTKCVISFLLQKWLRERATVLR